MTIARFFDREVIISRMKVLSGRKRGFASTATSEGHIQELDVRARQALGIIEGKAWKGWFPVDVDIQEGDRLVDQLTNISYKVEEVVVKNYQFGVNQHTQVILVEFNE